MSRFHRFVFALLLPLAALAGCESAPTEPAIADVTEPGTFALTRAGTSSPALTGPAELFVSTDEAIRPRVTMRTAGTQYEMLEIGRNVLAPAFSGPIEIGRHRFGLFGGDRGWSVSYWRSDGDGLFEEYGQATSGYLEITESSETVTRGRLDVTITVFINNEPVTRRFRGSFWATPGSLEPTAR